MKILVSGAAGQIGSELVPALREKYGKDNIIALYHKNVPKDAGRHVIGDAGDKEFLKRLIKDNNISVIYHLVGILSAKGEQDPDLAYRVNMDTLKNVLDIAKEILNFKKQGIRFDKMAILVRASYQMRMIEEALMQFKVPYRVIDGLKFYDRKEIKDLIAYLRFIYLQNDYLSFERIIACPKRGVGEKTVEKIIDNAQIMQMPILETIEDMADAGYFKGRADAMRDFCRCCKKIRNLIFENRKLDAIVESIYIESGYAQMLQDSVAENPQESGRVDNVREFIASLAQFDSIGQFLEHVALLSATDDKIIEDSVNLMTIHGSKGLEFDVVILPGLEDGTMPSARSIEESKSGAEEERRLFYVAITRAKVHLLMYTAEIRMTFGKLANCIPSRFLKEIKDHVEFKRVRGEF
jgi:DNA helicase-2/ATP-dependent DNA helicase PcrA